MNSLQIKLRSFARRTSLTKIIERMRPASGYEERANAPLRSAVHQGDVVRDVGANVGLYTELFCQWVGQDGLVVAFEPLSDSCAMIRQRIPECPWLRIENIALSDMDTAGMLHTSADSVENHIANQVELGESTGLVPVVIARGDTARNRLGQTPNVLKIDVEGFEEKVLAGMIEILASPELRGVLVEVHFKKLELRGKAMAPVGIEKTFHGHGFRTRWVDSSHLFAHR